MVRERLDDLLAAQPYFTGPALAAAVWAALGADDALFAGSSNPIRDLDLAAINSGLPAGLRQPRTLRDRRERVHCSGHCACPGAPDPCAAG